MLDDTGESSFDRWQEAQRRLHALEREIQGRAREHKSVRGTGIPDDLLARTRELHLEVDALFPAAMHDLEDQVRRTMARRPRLGDL